MMLTLDEIKRAAYLSRLAISDAEAEGTRQRLNDILAMISEMQAVNTEGVEPMSHAQDMAQRLREDHVVETDWRAAFEAIAPETDAGLYLVPRVIE